MSESDFGYRLEPTMEEELIAYGHAAQCAKCGAVQPDWWQFGVGCPTRKVYCLHHIPLRYRIKVWWQERRRG